LFLASNGERDIFVQKLNCFSNFSTSIQESVCVEYRSPSGKLYTQTGVYLDTVANQFGCDSIIRIDLTITPVDTSVVKLGERFIANATNAFYQWVDCNANFSPIPNATNIDFTPTRGGAYAVVVLQNGCRDTSQCFLSTVGLNELILNQDIMISPNPAMGQCSIELKKQAKLLSLVLRNNLGQVILEDNYLNVDRIELDLPPSAGLYFIDLVDEDGNRGTFKVINQD
jgi:hypothetical protein